MHKSSYKFIKKTNKCDMTIKSSLTKRTISEKKKWLKHKENPPKEKQKRELTFFCRGQLERKMGEWWI